MRRSSSRSLRVAALISVAVLAGAPALTSTWASGVRALWGAAVLLGDDLWYMGGTEHADPSPTGTDPAMVDYLAQISARYLDPTGFGAATPNPVITPEQFCPLVCVPGQPSLNFGDSVALGAQELQAAMAGNLAAGDANVIFGYSQSATVATRLLDQLVADHADTANLNYVLAADPNSPIGGILDRFQLPAGIEAFSLAGAPQHLPFLNVPLSMAPTPTDIGVAGVHNAIYAAEYDGWASFPQDPTNVAADVNAIAGIATIHPNYPIAGLADFDAGAHLIGTIDNTDFYMIVQNLPLLQWMYDGGPAGQFFGDAINPWLRLLIDWGYGNAGDPAVNGLTTFPAGSASSIYEQTVGVAGGPWAADPFGALYGSEPGVDSATAGIAGIVEKMDPLQVIAGVQNAGIQSFVGPLYDLLSISSGGGPLTGTEAEVITGLTAVLQAVSGYDLVNWLDPILLGGWQELAGLLQNGVTDLGVTGLLDELGLGLDPNWLVDLIGPIAVLDGPLIGGQPLLDLAGVAFDVFNFFGA